MCLSFFPVLIQWHEGVQETKKPFAVGSQSREPGLRKHKARILEKGDRIYFIYTPICSSTNALVSLAGFFYNPIGKLY